MTDETLDEVGHRLISTPGLLLVIAGLLRLATFAREEAIFEAHLHVLGTGPVGPLGLHAHFFSLASLSLELSTEEVISFHLDDFERSDLFKEQLLAHVRMRA